MNLTKRLSWLLALLLLISCGKQPSQPDITCQPNSAFSQASFDPLDDIEFSPIPGLAIQNANAPYVPNQLLVRYQEPMKTLSLAATQEVYRLTSQAVEATYNLTTLKARANHGPDLVRVNATDNMVKAALRLEQDPRVLYAEPNYYLEALSVPNDPQFNEQWNMTNFGLPEAWDCETGAASVTIAIIDSGVDEDHEDLVAKMLPGYDFCANSDCTATDDDPNPGTAGTAAHGTHVAGIAAASGNNGIGVTGVAYTGVKILPVKVFDNAGEFATVDSLQAGMRWAAGLKLEDLKFNGIPENQHPADILNLSLGAPIKSDALNEAVVEVRNARAIVIAASGNDTGGAPAVDEIIFAPANAPGAIAVGSVDQDYQRSSFSHYNQNGSPYYLTEGEKTVTLMAPGGSGSSSCGAVVSTLPNDNYGCMAGTSMAAPFVSGVAALLWSQNPGLSAEQVENRLMDSNNTYFEPDWDESEYGAGVICADAVLGADTLCGH